MLFLFSLFPCRLDETNTKFIKGEDEEREDDEMGSEMEEEVKEKAEEKEKEREDVGKFLETCDDNWRPRRERNHEGQERR